MKKTILVFAGIVVALLVLFRLSDYALISGDMKIELVISVIAIVFFFIGVWINRKSLSKRKAATYEIDHERIRTLEISEREYEVLRLIEEGLSNKEIGNRLYLSESTIKTHVSNLLIKLNAKRRTQAVQIAKDFQIL